MDSRTPAVMIVRARRGVVRESQRLCHIVPVPAPGTAAVQALTAYCGELIHPGESELMGAPAGMPCLACLTRAPVPGLPAPAPKAVRE